MRPGNLPSGMRGVMERVVIERAGEQFRRWVDHFCIKTSPIRHQRSRLFTDSTQATKHHLDPVPWAGDAMDSQGARSSSLKPCLSTQLFLGQDNVSIPGAEIRADRLLARAGPL